MRRWLGRALCSIGLHPKPDPDELVTMGRKRLCNRCTAWVWMPTAAQKMASELVFRLAVLLVLWVLLYNTLSCGRLIPGTSVAYPAVEKDGWVRAKCFAMRLPRLDACCVYALEMDDHRVVCMPAGGDDWQPEDFEKLRLETEAMDEAPGAEHSL